MATIEVDSETESAINFAAKVAGVSQGEIVRRLVNLYSEAPYTVSTASADESQKVAVFLDYSGQRIEAIFDIKTHRVEVVSGPLAGKAWPSPSGAAGAVVSTLNPTVNPSRNGWREWIVTETGKPLDSIR